MKHPRIIPGSILGRDVRYGSAIPGMSASPSFGGAAFSPLQLSPTNWYRGDLGVTLNGSTVSGWADQSGTADANKNLAQSTAANQPTYTASNPSYSGQATLSQTDGARSLKSAGLFAAAIAQPLTIYLVGHVPALQATAQIAFDSSNGTEVQFGAVVNTKTSARLYAGTTVVSGAAALGSPMVACCVVNGSSSAVYISAITTPAFTGSPGANSLPGLIVFNGFGGGQPWVGTIAELIIYSGAHNATQRGQVMNYAGSRYGITVAA